MKGLIYVLLLILASFLIVVLVKIIKIKSANKKESSQATPKIYFVTKTKKRKRDDGVSVPITVSGAVIEREKRR